jgi:peroxiredoxin
MGFYPLLKEVFMRAQALLPRYPVPALNLPLTNGERFVLGANPGEKFDLLVFYRGLHCPICAKYLLELERLAPEFASRGVQVVAISSDTEERGKLMAEKVKASGVKFAHGLSLRSAREWGLYISTTRGTTSIGIDEPDLFSEPGVFLVRPDGTLYYGAVQTMPFARPQFQDLIGAVDFAVAKDYPARGEYTGSV